MVKFTTLLTVLFIIGLLFIITISFIALYYVVKRFEFKNKQLEEDIRRFNLEQANKAKDLELKERLIDKQKEVTKASNAEQAAFLDILADPTKLFNTNGGK